MKLLHGLRYAVLSETEHESQKGCLWSANMVKSLLEAHSSDTVKYISGNSHSADLFPIC